MSIAEAGGAVSESGGVRVGNGAEEMRTGFL